MGVRSLLEVIFECVDAGKGLASPNGLWYDRCIADNGRMSEKFNYEQTEKGIEKSKTFSFFSQRIGV